MDIFFRLVDLLGTMISSFNSGKLDRQVKKIVLEAMNDPEYSKRDFDTLLHKTAIYDGDHQELRKVLISLGARRYQGKGSVELWGLPKRNRNVKSEEPYPNLLIGLITSVVGGLLVVAIVGLLEIVQPEVNADCTEIKTFQDRIDCQ